MLRTSKKWFCSFMMAVLLLSMALTVSAADKKAELTSAGAIKLELIAKQTCQLSVPEATASIKWKSSKSSVASVTKKGLITAKKKGTATITAKTGGKTFTCTISVSAADKKISKITFNKSKLSLYTQSIYQLTTKIQPENAANKNLIYSSSNTKVARVDGKGNIYTLTPGTAVIKAKATDGSGRGRACTVTVTEDPMKIACKKISVSVGSSQAIFVENLKSKDSVVWGTSNKNIATVKNGVITGVKEGTAVIAAKRADSSDGKTKSNKTVYCVVTVTKETAEYNAKGASANAKKFLKILRGYSERVESDYKKGIYWTYLNLDNARTFSLAVEKNNRKVNCALIADWGLRDMGILLSPKEVYGNKGGTFTFKGTSQGEVLSKCELVYGYKSAAQLVKEGKLLPGDICSMRDVGHTRIYAGDNKWFDTGKSICYDSKKKVFNTFGPTKGSMNGVVGYIIRIK